MNSPRRVKSDSSAVPRFLVHPKLFVFLDKKTGTRRFDVRANPDGSIPLDQAASLLAILCLARHQAPREFVVMVQADEDLGEGLTGRATKLIRTFMDTKEKGCALSRWQREVLEGVTQNLSNKEIAARLNLSERTVKFHMSTLFQKFGVRTRVELLLRVLPDVSSEVGRHLLPGANGQPLREVRPLAKAAAANREPGGHRLSREVSLALPHASGALSI